MRLSRNLFACLLIALATAPAAVAQEDGVFYDDDSAAGKEYAIPVEDARKGTASEGGGDGGGTGGGSTGSGDSGAGAGGSSGGERGDSSGADKKTPGGTLFGEGIERGAKTSGASNVVPSAVAGDDSGGTNAGLWMLGLAAGVLAGGALLALLIRRRQNPPRGRLLRSSTR